jgi:integrase
MGQALWRARGSAAEDALVFARKDGGPLDRGQVYRAVKVAAAKVGASWAGLHTLRHTCATLAFRSGWNAVQVQLLLGHHSPAFTLATYVHLLPEDLSEPSFLDGVRQRGSEASGTAQDLVDGGDSAGDTGASDEALARVATAD